ncbi:MAG: hypothetical protein IKU69_03150 [Roseburia sp.]|nr:hypothetical protein [Roseburia sp.]
MKHEINSQNTKSMLAETLISLLEKKPISKITVSELVNLCDINRKTFYYHFEDVYGLLEWHLDNEIQAAIDIIDPLDDFNTTVTYSIEYMEKYTYLRNCIDNPLGRDKVTQFLHKRLFPKSLEMVSELEKRHKKELDADFKDFLAKTMAHITVLSIIDTIENGNGINIEQMKRYASFMIDAAIAGFFESL